MRCLKCKGLLVEDEFSFYSQWLPGVRCLNCGQVKVDEEKVTSYYANQTKARGSVLMDEFQLYRTRRRGTKYYSNRVQYQ